VKSYFTSKNKITSIAIGGFDGMHLAHQELFNKLDKNGAIVVIETGYANLSPKNYREEYTQYPIYYYPLEEIKHLDGIEFVKLLKEEYPKLQTIVVGYDFHFGANRKYSNNDLKKLFDGDVKIVDEISYENIGVHSRVIRSFLSEGKIEFANKLLNKSYKIKGIQIKGQGLGKKQFVPTINISCDEFLLPQEGIYATKTILDNKEYKSITFIGHRVTTDGSFAIETHILDDFNNLVSHTIEIKFFEKIRDNKKFDNYGKLKQQILDDIKVVKKLIF
jgi:riboflavin kinase/FMN adenylyltransferase